MIPAIVQGVQLIGPAISLKSEWQGLSLKEAKHLFSYDTHPDLPAPKHRLLTRQRTTHLPGLLAALIAVTLLVAACGQATQEVPPEQDPPEEPSINLELASATVDTLRGGAGSAIDLTLTRNNGATDDIALSITGLPEDVTAVFEPATLSGTTLSSTLTITAAAAASEGSYPLNINGSGGELNHTAELTLMVNSLSVNGRVIGPSAKPLYNISVGSQGQTQLTDLNGEFTLTGLSVPYELSVWNTAEAWVQIYQGLSTSDLELYPDAAEDSSAVPSGYHQTTVSGELSGEAIPIGPGQGVVVCAEGLDVIASNCARVHSGESTYELPVQWTGGSSRDVILHALLYPGNGAPGSPYKGYGTAELSLAHGEAATTDIGLESELDTTTVTITAKEAATGAEPNGYLYLFGAVHLSPSLAIQIASIAYPDQTETMELPVLPGVSYSFMAWVGGGRVWQTRITDTAVTLTVPEAPQLVAPADEADATSSTVFTATHPTGGPMTFDLYPMTWSSVSPTPRVAVTTMADSITRPDLSPYGLAWPLGDDYSWTAIGHQGTTIEEALQSSFANLEYGSQNRNSFIGIRDDGAIVSPDSRRFTPVP